MAHQTRRARRTAHQARRAFRLAPPACLAIVSVPFNIFFDGSHEEFLLLLRRSLVVQAGLNLPATLLPQPSKCWDCKRVPPLHASSLLQLRHRASAQCTQGPGRKRITDLTVLYEISPEKGTHSFSYPPPTHDL